MTSDDVIRMARQAGAVFPADGSWHKFEFPGTLELFADLVAEAERNECEKVCEDVIDRVKPLYSVTAENCVKAIRARGNK